MQVHVPDAQMGTGKFHESEMCLPAQIVHTKMHGTALSMSFDHLLAVYPVEAYLLLHTPGEPMILLLLLFAPDVPIELSLQIRQVELFRWAASGHLQPEE